MLEMHSLKKLKNRSKISIIVHRLLSTIADLEESAFRGYAFGANLSSSNPL